MSAGASALLVAAAMLQAGLASAQAGGGNAAQIDPSLAMAGGANADSSQVVQSAEALHAEGVQLLREHQTESAVQRLSQAVALDKLSALYITDLGYAYLKQRRLVEAEAAFKRGIELDPSRPHAYEHLEQSVTQQPQRWEKRQELLRILEQGIGSNQDRATRARIELARIRAERSFGLTERAFAHIDELLQKKDVARAIEKQLRELRRNVEQDKKARALRDWPEPEIAPKDQAAFHDCSRASDPATRKTALATLGDLVSKYPAWREARAARATMLAAQGHYDEAEKELTILLRLAPSEPTYHRRLGILLAEHGGLLELERADSALRIAQALEPEWTELETMRLKLAERRYDSRSSRKPTSAAMPPPTEEAVRWYNEAEAKLEQSPADSRAAEDLLNQALRSSPGYVEAVGLQFSLTHRVPEGSVRALWNSASGMYALYQELSRVDPQPLRAQLDAWLQRAIELGSVEGLLLRALEKKRRGDLQGAELDLAGYLTLLTNEEEVQAVQMLRAELSHKRQDPIGDALLNARFQLEADDAEGALRILDAPCRAALDGSRLLQLGMVYERLGQNANALDCYEFELAKGTLGAVHAPVQRRIARLLARAEPALFEHPAARRLTDLSAQEPAALWALARHAFDSGEVTEAQRQIAAYLGRAEPNDRFVAPARELEQRLRNHARLVQEDRSKLRRRLLAAVVAAGALVLGALYWGLFRGHTVARAVRRRPRLFPELARLSGELRHDVLKHRTSALELLKSNRATLEQLRKTMLEPVPTSVMVADAYAQLGDRAGALGLRLRRLSREPTFGPFVKDLKRVELSLLNDGDPELILKIDERLRHVHQARLTQLLKLGPSCQLDAVEIQRWIAAVEAESTSSDKGRAAPALHMSHPCLKFPVDQATLFLIFANLLRNARAAVRDMDQPMLQVGLASFVDFTGRQQVRLQVADNAPTAVTDDMIEQQAPDRGLGILRDTARQWHGVMTIERTPEPYTKSVGVQFTT